MQHRSLHGVAAASTKLRVYAKAPAPSARPNQLRGCGIFHSRVWPPANSSATRSGPCSGRRIPLFPIQRDALRHRCGACASVLHEACRGACAACLRRFLFCWFYLGQMPSRPPRSADNAPHLASCFLQGLSVECRHFAGLGLHQYSRRGAGRKSRVMRVARGGAEKLHTRRQRTFEDLKGCSPGKFRENFRPQFAAGGTGGHFVCWAIAGNDGASPCGGSSLPRAVVTFFAGRRA